MTSRKFVALGFAAVLLSASFAAATNAATTPTGHVRHSSAHRAHMTKPPSRAAAANADHSADELNAQSLAKAQGAQ